VKTILKYVISIILAISIVIVFILELFSSTILNKNYLIYKMEKVNYYTKIYEQVKTNFENYIYQSGLEEDILDNIINEEKIKKDTLIILENIYNNLNEKIDMQEIRDCLNKRINESLGNRNINENQKKAIDTFIEQICNEYKNTIFVLGNGSQIGNKIIEIYAKVKLMKKIFLIIIGIDVILLFLLNIKKIYRFVVFIGISLNISGLILFMINIYINIKIKVNNIVIINDATSELLRNNINDIIISVNKIGIIIMITGITLILLSNIIHNARLYKIEKNKKTAEKNI